MDLFNKKPVYAPMIASRAAGSRFGFFADQMGIDEPALKLVGTKQLASTTAPQYELVNTATSPDDIIAVTHLDELIGTTTYNALPTETEIGFVRYKIKTHWAPTGTVVNAYCIKNGNRLSQSAMYTNGTLSMGSVTKVISRTNDDNDATFMVMDAPSNTPIGYGYQGDGNYNYWRSDNTYGRWRQDFTNNTNNFNGYRTATTNIGQCGSVLSTNTSNEYGTLIPFCRTGYNLGLNWNTRRYQLGAGNALDFPSSTSDETAFRNDFNSFSTANNVHVIVDGINSFVIMRDVSTGAANNVYYVKLDLENRTILSIEQIKTNMAPGFGREANTTEEDLVGNILHSVNARPTYFSTGSWYYTNMGAYVPSFPGYIDNMEAGSAMAAQSSWNTWPTHSNGYQNTNTQTGMDIIVSTRDGHPVYFGDHGHDNGGLFGVGNDTGVGTAPLNNLLIDYSLS